VLPQVDEVREGPVEEAVLENARRKAAAGLERAVTGGLALGVDTDVVLDGTMLGKPADAEGARERLELLSGRTHTVVSGLALLGPKPDRGRAAERSGLASSDVTFRRLDAATVAGYLASGEWRDRAGAYAIQGLGSILIERVEGDLSNVVGLPVRLLLELAPELLPAR
jgi:septum formation protein